VIRYCGQQILRKVTGNSPLLNDLENFKKELKENYGDPEVEAIVADGKLDNIKQRKYDHVFEYINQFKNINQNFHVFKRTPL